MNKSLSDSEAEKRCLIQLLQTHCKHTRCEYIAETKVLKCLDCDKLIHSKRR